MPRLGPGARAEIGVAVLAAAETVVTRLVRERLTAFAAMHERYIEAQRIVAAAEVKLAAAAAVVRRCDAEQDAAADHLARALLLEGQPRANPFRGFGVPSPAVLQRRAAAAEAKAIHKLVAAVRRLPGCAAATLKAADAAASAAGAVEKALAAMLPPAAALHTARLARDAVGQQWNRALAALKLHALAAADDGAPQLHTALFRSVRRTGRKKVRVAGQLDVARHRDLARERASCLDGDQPVAGAMHHVPPHAAQRLGDEPRHLLASARTARQVCAPNAQISL
jgi:hypothetical protein